MDPIFENHYTAPTTEDLMALRAVAGGKRPADLIIRNGRVVFVHTGEIREMDVAVCGRHIAAVASPGVLTAKRVYDAAGQYMVPNFIESHFHIEYSMLTPGELAQLVVPKGTTTILADPNCIANIWGLPGIAYIRTTRAPLRIFLQVSSSVPRTPTLELGGCRLSAEDIGELLRQPYAVSLGESVPFDLSRDAAEVLALALDAGKRATGHTARLRNEPLWAYLAGGVCDDHNAATLEEVKDRVRLGAGIAIQSGSMSNYLADILGKPEKLGETAYHLFFSADDKHVGDLRREGHIDHHVRSAIELGVEPALAIRMATLNAAMHFRIDHLVGSITPSRLADFMLLPDLKEISPSTVFVGGQRVAENGKPLFQNEDTIPEELKHTIHLGAGFSKENFRIAAPAGKTTVKARVAELYDGYYKRLLIEELPVVDGAVGQDVAHDLAKVVVVDRHLGTGSVGTALIRGTGLKKGAIAATNNCENQNLVVIGTSDEEIMHAIRVIEEMGGGYAAVAGGQVLAKLPLAVGGVMSELDWRTVDAQLQTINKVAGEMGCQIESPFMIMAFIGLAGVPDLGLTEKGLIDVVTQTFTDVIVAD
ncbi:Adenine deaminase [Oscillibacter sp. PC13]|uniref:adenine deaminase n=1 Tax=Oscillibacter sp. PC13 TaxID=1855299 RepID=UPI0008DF028C|nr:adenine deaminase C-terminal domain-containing protein [Oscillibacter sp. PC13]SFQ10124.1 Adenine deaminase [Oscillibacter sp. PC13]